MKHGQKVKTKYQVFDIDISLKFGRFNQPVSVSFRDNSVKVSIRNIGSSNKRLFTVKIDKNLLNLLLF